MSGERNWKIAHSAGRAAWFSYPLARFVEMIDPVADSLRSLPLEQLETEADALMGSQSHLADGLMLRLYTAERKRRADPGQKFDVELELALQRLENMTTEPDRVLVTDIGRKIYEAGGDTALEAARQRMIAAAKPVKAVPREKVLAKRWAGIAGGRAD